MPKRIRNAAEQAAAELREGVAHFIQIKEQVSALASKLDALVEPLAGHIDSAATEIPADVKAAVAKFQCVADSVQGALKDVEPARLAVVDAATALAATLHDVKDAGPEDPNRLVITVSLRASLGVIRSLWLLVRGKLPWRDILVLELKRAKDVVASRDAAVLDTPGE